ncbi:MAG: DNA photolyase family protein, partial [Bacteroidota bacterium]|nr:DNA photolyase family protein [Bacteroidota bacterium]
IGSLRVKDYELKPSENLLHNFFKQPEKLMPSLKEMKFVFNQDIPKLDLPAQLLIQNYDQTRNLPGVEGTSRMGVHLRFGTVSVRQLVSLAININETYLKELVWREFFMQMLWHYPRIATQACKTEYENIEWRNNENEFESWCRGKTGYPIVDAGMRELNETGFMHNRVRMVVASFLVKDLLIDWKWGEAYFARKLLDYDLASNNGNWQWVAGCGCDAAPYFRIFNPSLQTVKFDKEEKYIKQWVPEYGSDLYVKQLIDHKIAKERCLIAYKKAMH